MNHGRDRLPCSASLLTGAVNWIPSGSVIRALALEQFQVRTAISGGSYHGMGTQVGAGLLIHMGFLEALSDWPSSRFPSDRQGWYLALCTAVSPWNNAVDQPSRSLPPHSLGASSIQVRLRPRTRVNTNGGSKFVQPLSTCKSQSPPVRHQCPRATSIGTPASAVNCGPRDFGK